MLTNEAHPPPFQATDSGLRLTILQRNVGQKWWGCMLTAARHILITTHQLGISSAPSFEFFSRKPVKFTGPTCFHFQKLKIFQYPGFICRMFWKRAQSNYNSQLAILDVHFRQLCRSTVGRHSWNERVKSFIANAHANTWSYIIYHMQILLKLARPVANLPAHRWVQRLLSWHFVGTCWYPSRGPDIRGDQNFTHSARTQILDRGEKRLWMTACGTHNYVHSLNFAACKYQLCTCFAFCPCAQKRARHWRAGLNRPDLGTNSWNISQQ